MRLPRDISRRVRAFPVICRALYARREYLRRTAEPNSPDDLEHHRCVGLSAWNLAGEGQSITISPVFLVRCVAHLHGDLAAEPSQTRISSVAGYVTTPVRAFVRAEAADAADKVLLDFLSEYLGKPGDPRLLGADPKGHYSTPGNLEHTQK